MHARVPVAKKISRVRRPQLERAIRLRTEAHPVKTLQPSTAEMNRYSRVAKEPDVGRRFPKIPLWI
jgi:hypothetical protein